MALDGAYVGKVETVAGGSDRGGVQRVTVRFALPLACHPDVENWDGRFVVVRTLSDEEEMRERNKVAAVLNAGRPEHDTASHIASEELDKMHRQPIYEAFEYGG